MALNQGTHKLKGVPFPRLSVLYADRKVFVLNKPPGLVCQFESGVALNKLDGSVTFTHLLDELKAAFDLPSNRFYPVHRLDKTTTGALLLAASLPIARDLSQQFQRRVVEKTYLALVHGSSKSYAQTNAEIRVPLAFNDGRVSLATGNDFESKMGRTEWEVVSTSPIAPVTLLRLKLHSGLKHQLRIHLAQCLKTPILGDHLYSCSRQHNSATQRLNRIVHIPDGRVFLHCSKMSFYRYRKSGSKKRYRLGVIAPMPEDFVQVCESLAIPVDGGSDEVVGGVFQDGIRISSGADLGDGSQTGLL